MRRHAWRRMKESKKRSIPPPCGEKGAAIFCRVDQDPPISILNNQPPGSPHRRNCSSKHSGGPAHKHRGSTHWVCRCMRRCSPYLRACLFIKTGQMHIRSCPLGAACAPYPACMHACAPMDHACLTLACTHAASRSPVWHSPHHLEDALVAEGAVMCQRRLGPVAGRAPAPVRGHGHTQLLHACDMQVCFTGAWPSYVPFSSSSLFLPPPSPLAPASPHQTLLCGWRHPTAHLYMRKLPSTSSSSV